MEAFESHYVCNHSDETGRYAYDQQPGVGHWNCSKLLQATLPLLDEVPEKAIEVAYAILERYGPVFVERNLASWRAKLGLREARDTDAELINALVQVLERSRADFTNFFRALAARARPRRGPRRLRPLAGGLSRAPRAGTVRRHRARGAHEPGQPEVRAAQPPGPGRHREGAGR
jgi:hypothetical protein